MDEPPVVSPNGQLVASDIWDESGNESKTVRIRDTQMGEAISELLLIKYTTECAAFSVDGTRIVTKTAYYLGYFVQVWDVWSGAPLGEPFEVLGAYFMAFSLDSQRIVLASRYSGIPHVGCTNYIILADGCSLFVEIKRRQWTGVYIRNITEQLKSRTEVQDNSNANECEEANKKSGGPAQDSAAILASSRKAGVEKNLFPGKLFSNLSTPHLT